VSEKPAAGCILYFPANRSALVATQSGASISPEALMKSAFTTSFEPAPDPNEYEWIGCPGKISITSIVLLKTNHGLITGPEAAKCHFTIQASPDVIHWQNIGTATAGTNGVFEFEDTVVGSFAPAVLPPSVCRDQNGVLSGGVSKPGRVLAKDVGWLNNVAGFGHRAKTRTCATRMG